MITKDEYGNESNAHVVILDEDGTTIFNGQRTVRNVRSDGQIKSGVVKVNCKEYDVILGKDWKWIGPAFAI